MNGAVRHPSGWAAMASWLDHLDVGTIFGLPGDDMALLEALESDGRRMLLCRDQRHALFMAAGYAHARRGLGVCLVGRGPAFTNTLTGLLEARSGGHPVLLVAEGTATSRTGTGAFQELEQLPLARPLVKWAYRVEHPDRLCDALEHAGHVAVSGAPGPVYLEIPEDVAGASTVARGPWRPLTPQRPAPAETALASVFGFLRHATRPLLLAGGGARHGNDDGAIERLADALGAALFVTASGRGAVDERHPSFCGLAGLYARPPLSSLLDDADLVVALGSRLEETVLTGRRPRPDQQVVQVTLDERDAAFPYADAFVLGDAGTLARQLLEALGAPPAGRAAWVERIADSRRRAHAAAAELRAGRLVGAGDSPMVTDVLAALDRVLPEDRVLVQENGLHDMWSYFYPHWAVPGQADALAPSEQTSLGFGAAAALGVACARPDRPVAALVGDGAFDLVRGELTAVEDAGVAVLYVVLDNGGYGWLQRNLDARLPAGAAHRFVRPGRGASAGDAQRVERLDDLGPALDAAWDRCRQGRTSVVRVGVALDDAPPGIEDLLPRPDEREVAQP